MPDNSIEFAQDDSLVFANREVHSATLSEADSVRAVGQALEARKVVWGSFFSQAESKTLRVQLLDVPSGKMSRVLSSSGSGWFDVICEIRKQVLREMGIIPTSQEEERMNVPLSGSPEALQLFATALDEKDEGEPIERVESNLRSAVSLDPHFSSALEALAFVLLTQGHFSEATRMARRACDIHHESATAHYILGVGLLQQNLRTLANDELTEAQRLDPDEPRILLKLGFLHTMNGQWEEAASLYKKVERLAPYIPLSHAELARVYLNLGMLKEAEQELRLAEFYNPGNDGQILLVLAELHSTMHHVSEAMFYYEKYITGMKRVGLDTSDAQAAVADLKPRLKPTLLTATMPRIIAPEQMKELLRAKLATNECVLVQNPFVCSNEMTNWALREVGGASDDLTKAERLFEALSHRLDVEQQPSYRTAEQVYQHWSDPKASFACQDYTAFFIALARSVGLKTFYTQVTRDCYSRLVGHACPGVFIGSHLLLADPVYFWFGVPHQGFEVMDDLGAIAMYLSESKNLPSIRVATKLTPDRPLIWFMLAAQLAAQAQYPSAQEALGTGLDLDSTSWLALFAQGTVELYSKKFEPAVLHLQKCLSLGVDSRLPHYYLAIALDMKGDFAHARDEYRSYLQGKTETELAAQARERITVIDEALSEGKGSPLQYRSLLWQFDDEQTRSQSAAGNP